MVAKAAGVLLAVVGVIVANAVITVRAPGFRDPARLDPILVPIVVLTPWFR